MELGTRKELILNTHLERLRELNQFKAAIWGTLPLISLHTPNLYMAAGTQYRVYRFVLNSQFSSAFQLTNYAHCNGGLSWILQFSGCCHLSSVCFISGVLIWCAVTHSAPIGTRNQRWKLTHQSRYWVLNPLIGVCECNEAIKRLGRDQAIDRNRA